MAQSFFSALVLWVTGRPGVLAWMTGSRAGRRLAGRFVAGETVEDALRAAARINARGMRATLDYLGENVSRPEEAEAARDVYLKLLDEIHARCLDTNISVKLTQIGLDLSDELCQRHLAAIVERAAGYNNFVRVDMEGSVYTERTLKAVRCVHRTYPNVGAVIQAYLYRSDKDVEELVAADARIRLCKGAYQEPASIAYPRKADVDRNYVRLAQVLLDRARPDGAGHHALATHDSRILAAAEDYARRNRIVPEAFEFQMLYGIRRDLQRKLLRKGWRVRVYIPFGSQWFPYLTRRLAERPANLFFLVRNLFQG